MKASRISVGLLVVVFLLSSSFVLTTNEDKLVDRLNIRTRIHLLSDNPIENPGFETGSFSPWINLGNIAENSIQTSIVHSGSYALKMESFVDSYPYDGTVSQDIQTHISLDEAPSFNGFIYPTDTGQTCGSYGCAFLDFTIRNTVDDTSRTVRYTWSGWNIFSDSRVNSSWAVYSFYDWTTNTWHELDRSIATDYTSVFGTATPLSSLVIDSMTMINHASNGEPGTFYVDDLSIGNIDTTTPSTTTTTTTPTTTTTTQTSTTQTPTTSTGVTTQPTPPQTDYSLMLTIAIAGGTIGIILIVGIISCRKGGLTVASGDFQYG
ncbi:MAG: hypothetical protein ACFFF4_07905 [Candidatus Thorarchaeota archaeon]